MEAHDRALAAARRRTGWCARSGSISKRTLQAPRRLLAVHLRADRARLLLRGHPARAGAGRRPLLHARRRARGRRAARRPPLRLTGDELRAVSDGQRPHAAREPLPRRAGARRRPQGPDRRGPRRGGRGARPASSPSRPTTSTGRTRCASPSRSAPRSRPDALTGMEASLRFGGPETLETKIFARLSAWQNWIFQRPNAVGPKGALQGLRHGPAGRIRPEESVMAAIDYIERIPNNVDLPENRRLLARAGGLAAEVPRLVAGHGARGLPGQGRLPAHRDQRGRQGLGPVRLREDARVPLGHLPRRARARARRSTSATTRASPPGRRCRASTAARSAASSSPRATPSPRRWSSSATSGRTCPSLYDLRNLFQVNVEEGRHLWAMVYLLDAHFGRDGREESEALLQRRSGDRDKPRILGAFNEKTPDWLSFFMFCFFTDRDGKYQLASLAESGFDPLSRTCRFMLTEEAHHMFVGESGRRAHRPAHLRADARAPDRRRAQARRASTCATIQKYLNFHCSVSLDLFGSEVSTNAANFYTAGLKGRFEETKKERRSPLKDGDLPGDRARRRARSSRARRPALVSLNERLRDDYVADCAARRGPLERGHPEATGSTSSSRCPTAAFHRAIGAFAEVRVSPDGRVISQAEWDARHRDWLPTEEDQAYVPEPDAAGDRARASSPAGSPRPRAASTASPSTSSTSGWAERGAMAPRRPCPRSSRRSASGPPLGMYSHGMVAPGGEIVVVAGQVGHGRAGAVAGGDVGAADAGRPWRTSAPSLEAAGCAMGDVVRFQTFLTHAADIDGFMQAARARSSRATSPDGAYPPNTLLVVSPARAARAAGRDRGHGGQAREAAAARAVRPSQQARRARRRRLTSRRRRMACRPGARALQRRAFFVDRHVAEGPRRPGRVLPRGGRRSPTRGLQELVNRAGNALRELGVRAGAAGALPAARLAGVPGRVLGRDQDRRRPDPHQHHDAGRRTTSTSSTTAGRGSPSSRSRCSPRPAPCSRRRAT